MMVHPVATSIPCNKSLANDFETVYNGISLAKLHVNALG
jgi:hypothetical protein